MLKIFNGRLLSKRIFSGQYGPNVYPRMTLWMVSRDQFNPIRFGEDLVVNYDSH